MEVRAKRDKILVVDEDPALLDFLTHQVLQPMGHQVFQAADGAQAIEAAMRVNPDLIIASLTLPGLSGKDILVALSAQGLDVPVLLTAPPGRESDALQAFRLGAKDCLIKPLREAEVAAALERALMDVRLRRERQELSQKLAESNRQLERRVRELTTLYGIGKVVTSTTDQARLFDKLMEGSLYVTEADMGWVLLQLEKSDQLVLRAQRNLPAPQAAKLHRLWKDGVSELVMLSGQSLSLHGEGLNQFVLSNFCQAVLIAPIKVRDQPIGLLCVGRIKPRAFTDRDQAMLEAVADYASISLVNARLFKALEARARRLEEVVSQSQGTVALDPAFWGDLERRLHSMREKVIALRAASPSPEDKRAFENLMAEVDGVLERVRAVQEIGTSEPQQPIGGPG